MTDYIECERGKLKGIDMDMNTIPDAVNDNCYDSAFAEGETTIRNIYNWRVKETDRLSAMAYLQNYAVKLVRWLMKVATT